MARASGGDARAYGGRLTYAPELMRQGRGHLLNRYTPNEDEQDEGSGGGSGARQAV